MKETKPPYLLHRVLTGYCKATALEDLLGDLDEMFADDVGRIPLWRARLNYNRRAASLLFSYAVLKRRRSASYSYYSYSAYHPAMLKNYLTIAVRSLSRHKFFTTINILGMAVGMSIALLLIAMLSFLWRYDTFHTNKDRIYRVISLTHDKERATALASAPALLAPRLASDYSGIEEVVRIRATLPSDVTVDNNSLSLEGFYADANFLKVFTFPLLKGNPVTALDEPHTVVITASAATRLFGTTEALGKVITMGDHGDFQITGILENHPKHSHLQFEAVASHKTLETAGHIPTESWTSFRNSYVYLLLPEQHTTDGIETYLNTVTHDTYATEKNFKASFELQSLLSIAPGRALSNQQSVEWDYTSIMVFIILTLLILLPACFNYANISIARALKRMKEIGLRKVMGGQRNQIFVQFIVETVIIAVASLVVSFYLFMLVKPEFMDLLVDSDALDLTPTWQTYLYFLGFAVLLGFLAGVIPALYFARLTPIEALRPRPSGRVLSATGMRKGMLVLQFALSLGFILSVVIVLNQYRHSVHHNFGFDQENILDVELQGVDAALVKQQLLTHSAVQQVSLSSAVLGTGVVENTWVRREALSDSTEVAQLFTDEHFIKNLGLTMLAGDDFTAEASRHKNAVVVNEEFLKAFHIPSATAAPGQTFLLPSGEEVTVAGVVKNFHYTFLRYPIRSFFFRYDTARVTYANVKVVTNDVYQTITDFENLWKPLAGEKKFASQFFDDEIRDAYNFHFSMVKICGFMGLLAITIACLGLLGMVVFSTENRMKEVGVRKVMGASTMAITLLLSKDFFKLMVIGAGIAIPLTWLFFDKVFLRMQYYHVPVGVMEVMFSLLILFVLGLGTVLSQTVKAARSNPVDTLRSE